MRVRTEILNRFDVPPLHPVTTGNTPRIPVGAPNTRAYQLGSSRLVLPPSTGSDLTTIASLVAAGLLPPALLGHADRIPDMPELHQQVGLNHPQASEIRRKIVHMFDNIGVETLQRNALPCPVPLNLDRLPLKFDRSGCCRSVVTERRARDSTRCGRRRQPTRTPAARGSLRLPGDTPKLGRALAPTGGTLAIRPPRPPAPLPYLRHSWPTRSRFQILRRTSSLRRTSRTRMSTRTQPRTAQWFILSAIGQGSASRDIPSCPASSNLERGPPKSDRHWLPRAAESSRHLNPVQE